MTMYAKTSGTIADTGLWLESIAPALDEVRTWARSAEHEALLDALRQCEAQTRASMTPAPSAVEPPEYVGTPAYRRDWYLQHAAEAMSICVAAIESAMLEAALHEARLAAQASEPDRTAGADYERAS